MSKYLFLGAPIQAELGASATYKQRFEATGRNTGNLLIGNSLFKQLVLDDHRFGLTVTPEQANEEFDAVVIPAANFIYEKFDFGPYADFLVKTNLPCLMVGLGAQAPAKTNRKLNIPEGTLRFLSIVSERTKIIGVRGDFTAELMCDLGFKNVRPVGCPSFYRSLSRNLTIKRLSERPTKISINGSRNVTEHSSAPDASRRVEGQLIALSITKDLDYVIQNEEPEMSVVSGINPTSDVLSQLDGLRRKFDIPVSLEGFVQHIKDKYRLFFDISDWDSYICQFDISIGSRFHGNIIALTMGVPAIVLTHDARTTELCQLMHIPHMHVEDIGHLDVGELHARADYAACERQYTLLYDRYAEFLNENGFKHRLSNTEPTVRSGGRIEP